MDHRSQSLRRWWLGSPLTLRERRDLRERLSGRLEDLVRQGAIRLSDGARHCDGANFCRRRKHVLERFCERRHDLLEGAGEPRADLVSLSRDLARGRRLYAGLSDFPAWRLARTATIAELRGAVPIAGLQVEYSLVERTPEHELLPAGHALGLGVVTFSPLGGGMLTGKYRNGEKGRAEGFGGAGFQPENTPQRTAILDALLAVAKELDVTPSEVAIAWVAAKGSLPIIGPRTPAQLENNLASTKVTLSPAQIARLDTVSAVAPTFPGTVLDDPRIKSLVTGGKFDRIDAPTRPVA